MRILLYFTNPFANNEVVRAGFNDLVRIPLTAVSDLRVDDESQLVLSKALLSTSDAAAVKVQGLSGPVPTSFTLHQNYPNPFNPTTTIEFTLGAPGASGAHNVELNVYNILGQRVVQLFSGLLPAGNHQVVWNGTDSREQKVASGIYLYKLQVDQESQTRKMVLLK
jgi:flagellar hook assembly protein FlgD